MLNFPLTARITDLSAQQSLAGEALQQAIAECVAQLQALNASRLLLWADSSLDWLLLDLACLDSGTLLVPMPLFASEAQLAHVLAAVGPEYLLSHQLLNERQCTVLGLSAAGRLRGFYLYQSSAATRLAALPVPAGTQKITFTSGSTGQPKGVCLSVATQLTTAQSLVERLAVVPAAQPKTLPDAKSDVPAEPSALPRHLCLLPFSLLLENVAGVYAPLLAGGEVLLAADADRGFAGSQLAQPEKLLALISRAQPKSLILVPELLQLLVQAAGKGGWQAPASLQFIAVGGAKVAVSLLRQAAALRLPVYQGYGLSECGSVVALSAVAALDATDTQLHSCGRPLVHLQVRLSQSGEIEVKTPFLGYLGQSQPNNEDWVATGDLGQWSADGDLQILGRRKNLLISSFGRNISPEWVETELLKSGLVRQAVLFGDARPYCVALLYAPALVSDAQLDHFVASINQQLPDYARVGRYARLSAPLSEAAGTYTSNGRPKRAEIARQYQALLAALYLDKPDLDMPDQDEANNDFVVGRESLDAASSAPISFYSQQESV